MVSTHGGPVTDEAVIRRAVESDLPQVARLAADLVRMHHQQDGDRFLLVDRVEEGYGRWLLHELGREHAVVLVANVGARIVGYGYGTLEGRDWNMLLDAHGALHDVFVAPDARRAGIGVKLVNAMIAALEELGAPRIVLSTMVSNEGAQGLFRRCGFRPTMIEMTRSAAASG